MRACVIPNKRTNAQCSGVEALANTLHKYVPGAYVFQGECGAPSTWERGGAMAHPAGFNFTEVKQAKWNLRSPTFASCTHISILITTLGLELKKGIREESYP